MNKLKEKMELMVKRIAIQIVTRPYLITLLYIMGFILYKMTFVIVYAVEKPEIFKDMELGYDLRDHDDFFQTKIRPYKSPQEFSLRAVETDGYRDQDGNWVKKRTLSYHEKVEKLQKRTPGEWVELLQKRKQLAEQLSEQLSNNRPMKLQPMLPEFSVLNTQNILVNNFKYEVFFNRFNKLVESNHYDSDVELFNAAMQYLDRFLPKEILMKSELDLKNNQHVLYKFLDNLINSIDISQESYYYSSISLRVCINIFNIYKVTNMEYNPELMVENYRIIFKQILDQEIK